MASPVVDTPIPDQTSQNNQAFSLDISQYIKDADAVDERLYSITSGLPANSGLSIDTLSGVISGTPTAEDVAALPMDVTVRCTDSSGFAEQVIRLTVPPTGLIPSMMGWAAAAGTTGGSNQVVASSASELRTLLGQAGNYITINPAIGTDLVTWNMGGNLSVADNVTLDASGVNLKLRNIRMFAGTNNIIHNLWFDGFREQDYINIGADTERVWIDHCRFSNIILETVEDPEFDKFDDCINVGSQLSSNESRAPKYITLSFLFFDDTVDKCINLGFGVNNSADEGIRASCCYNFYDNATQRQPNPRWSWVHCFNQYHRFWSGVNPAITPKGTAQAFVENDIFESTGTQGSGSSVAVGHASAPEGNGFFVEQGSWLNAGSITCTIETENPGSVFNPYTEMASLPNPHNIDLQTADATLRDLVEARAGNQLSPRWLT